MVDQDSEAITIRRMLPGDAADVARLHRREIHLGFLSSLGPRFLRNLYAGLARSPAAIVSVAVKDGRVVGFAAATAAVGGAYRQLLRRRWWKFGLILLPRLLSPSVVRKCWETLRYPQRADEKDLPPAELLSIAVDRAEAGQGVGRRLARAVLNDLWAQGVTGVRVVASADYQAANAFYPALGFRFVRTVLVHGRATHVYVIDRPAAESPSGGPPGSVG